MTKLSQFSFLLFLFGILFFMFYDVLKLESDKLRSRRNKTFSRLPNLDSNFETDNKKNCVIPALESFEQFFSYGKKKKVKCGKKVLIGGSEKYGDDGAKYVCLDDRFKFERGNCTVLSFGINNEWSFDDAVSELGCTVYAFDHTMNRGDFDRSSQIHFYNIGLSKSNKVDQYGEVNRYKTILKKLNLMDRQIDYLKIDIEQFETEFLSDVLKKTPQLLDNVKQIGMEIHPGEAIEEEENMMVKENSMFKQLWNGMNGLECFGFSLFDYRKNSFSGNDYLFRNRVESHCYEVVWIRTKT